MTSRKYDQKIEEAINSLKNGEITVQYLYLNYGHTVVNEYLSQRSDASNEQNNENYNCSNIF